jgi:hypothetical protein
MPQLNQAQWDMTIWRKAIYSVSCMARFFVAQPAG